MLLNYVSLAILILVFLIIFYGVLILHDIPYEIAKKRNHPHLDAIHVAGWVSLNRLSGCNDCTRTSLDAQAVAGSGNLNEETSNASCSASSFRAWVRAAASSINEAFC